MLKNKCEFRKVILCKISHSQSALICCVVGSNAPYPVMFGFSNPIWNYYNVWQVSALKDGLFLVKFDIVENRDLILQRKLIFFDKKSLLMKVSSEELTIDRDIIKQLPIWAKLLELDFKYGDIPNLSKIENSKKR